MSSIKKEVAGVRILTQDEQLKAINQKKVKQKIKNIAVNTLENPFVLEWPEIGFNQKTFVIECLKKSFEGTKNLKFQPPWQLIRRKGKQDRALFKRKYFAEQLEEEMKTDPNLKGRFEHFKNVCQDLIFGYNANMKGIEKGRLAALLVKKNTKPVHLVKSFLPACANNGIPLFPIEDLDQYFQFDFSVMCVGLKIDCKKESSNCYSLYKAICTSLNISDLDEFESEDEADGKTSGMQEKRILMSNKVEINYLKRTSLKKRIFVPGQSQNILQKELNTASSSDFISFGLASSGLLKSSDDKTEDEKEKTSIDISTVSSDNFFILDDTGMGKNTQIPKSMYKSDIINIDVDAKKRKRKGKNESFPEYNSANVKRIKNNPNKKKNNIHLR